ncbi:MAG: hypothetical protein HOP19_13380 [Acidobacteria bacterium]|nr:hypothetical protein [Acidobacteriota bacterium]
MLGIYQDREFGESYLFLKHRPTLKFYFRAPLGESERTLKELAPEQRAEEMLFQAYVEQGGGNQRCLRLFIW